MSGNPDPDLHFAALDLLGSGVVLLDAAGKVVFVNLAACQLFGLTARRMLGLPFETLFVDSHLLDGLMQQLRQRAFGQQGLDLSLAIPGGGPLPVHCLAVMLESPADLMLLELHEIHRRRRIDREEQLHDTARAHREVLRNLAHEIKNPLGGIRGAAQLLESDPDPAALHEYTGVIIKEVDRLQKLLDQLLAPNRPMQPVTTTNIHEVCERVRLLVQAEYPQGLQIERDYDASLPELQADKAQLIQAVLNLVRNAAQAMQGRGKIVLKTRIARHVVIARIGYRLAVALHVMDDGPGVPAELLDRMFLPLVSGREGGSGLGLTLAQAVVERHGGSIECESRAGRTDFRMLLPLL
ncbi:MAG: nitrogen regulation protein NR(II) [Lautropia sp.]|nr:nitrogen regulation protein NR(II) [Lautropia sp.]